MPGQKQGAAPRFDFAACAGRPQRHSGAKQKPYWSRFDFTASSKGNEHVIKSIGAGAGTDLAPARCAVTAPCRPHGP
jgi:hypothetical protein